MEIKVQAKHLFIGIAVMFTTIMFATWIGWTLAYIVVNKIIP